MILIYAMIFFYKSVLSLDSQLVDFGRAITEASILYLGENNLKQNPGKTGKTSLKHTPLVFSIFWWKKFLAFI
jgi:hypothetical protein